MVKYWLALDFLLDEKTWNYTGSANTILKFYFDYLIDYMTKYPSFKKELYLMALY